MKLDPTTAGLVGTLSAAIIAAISGWVVRRANRRVDAATVRRTEAEAASIEVKTARELLADVKTSMAERLAEQRTDYEQRITALRERHDSEIKALNERMSGLEDRSTRMLAAILAHVPWDADALAEVRRIRPEWPSPPPIDRY